MLAQPLRHWSNIDTTQWSHILFEVIIGYERVYMSLCDLADTPFHNLGEKLYLSILITLQPPVPHIFRFSFFICTLGTTFKIC